MVGVQNAAGFATEERNVQRMMCLYHFVKQEGANSRFKLLLAGRLFVCRHQFASWKRPPLNQHHFV
jgi:hypothetical protein